MDKAEESQAYWSLDLYERTVMGLRLNYLSGKKYAQHVTLCPTTEDKVPEGGATTSHERITCEDRALNEAMTYD